MFIYMGEITNELPESKLPILAFSILPTRRFLNSPPLYIRTLHEQWTEFPESGVVGENASPSASRGGPVW